MYKIGKNEKCLLVQFKGDFDYSTIKRIFNDELIMPDFNRQHDIWLIEHHQAQIRLGEIQTLVDDFRQLCPKNTTNKKLAIVAHPGLTFAILDLLADGLDRKLPFSCRTFSSLKEAEDWVGGEACRTA
jgi:hypothetical protein